jgi:predicted DNA-binding transcriptional regulator AlpA
MTPDRPSAEVARERIGVAVVAAILGVSRREVQHLAKKGQIPGARKVASVWTFNESRVRAWLRRGESAGCQPTYTAEVLHGTAVTRSSGNSNESAYEQAIGLRPRAA